VSLLKKLFFASLIIFIVSILFLGIYRLSFYKPKEVAPTAKKENPAQPVSATQPEKDTAKISAISDEAILSPALSSEGLSIKYYSQKNGHSYEISFDGTNKKTLSANDLIDLKNILWSPDKTKVISKFFQSDSSTRFSSYDYSAGKGDSLDKNIREAAWDQSSSKIFYVYFDPKSKKATLNISDPDGSNWKKLADLAYSNASVAPIPQSGSVSFWNKADNMSQTSLESIPTVGGQKKSLFKEKFGADYLWDNSGNNILISHSDAKGGSKMQLAIVNYNGGEYSNLGIPTFVSKCAWSKNNKILYYALPGNLPESAMLPNDYNDGKIKTSDTFWKMDMASRQSERIIELSELQKINAQFDASDLFLSPDEGLLFFINKLDGKLYQISL